MVCKIYVREIKSSKNAKNTTFICSTGTSPSHDLVKTRPRLFQFLLHIKPSHQTMSTTSSQSLSSALTVISVNIEGPSAIKASMLSDLCKEQHCHCLCLQETHRGERKARPRIPGMTLVAERPHDKYGSAIFSLKVHQLSKLPCYQICARNSIVTVCVSKKHTEVKEKRGPEFLE